MGLSPATSELLTRMENRRGKAAGGKEEEIWRTSDESKLENRAASFEEPNLISENQIKEIMRCMIWKSSACNNIRDKPVNILENNISDSNIKMFSVGGTGARILDHHHHGLIIST